MDVLTAIHTRHSTGKVKPDPVPRAVIEKLLLAAVQAPNHHKVRPWRFVVLSGGRASAPGGGDGRLAAGSETGSAS
jgi:nitroreductase